MYIYKYETSGKDNILDFIENTINSIVDDTGIDSWEVVSREYEEVRFRNKHQPEGAYFLLRVATSGLRMSLALRTENESSNTLHFSYGLENVKGWMAISERTLITYKSDGDDYTGSSDFTFSAMASVPDPTCGDVADENKPSLITTFENTYSTSGNGKAEFTIDPTRPYIDDLATQYPENDYNGRYLVRGCHGWGWGGEEVFGSIRRIWLGQISDVSYFNTSEKFDLGEVYNMDNTNNFIIKVPTEKRPYYVYIPFDGEIQSAE